MRIKKKIKRLRKCNRCGLFMFVEKDSSNGEIYDEENKFYLSKFTNPDDILQEMNRLHDAYVSILREKRYLVFWGESTKRYSQLFDKYHMEMTTPSPKAFQYEDSLITEALEGLSKFGIVKKKD